jgi:ABC-type dipeptide/oligopeptide/nickel transport system permease subunit
VTDDTTKKPSKGMTTLGRLRLLTQQPSSVVAAVVFLLFLLAGVFAEFVTPYGPTEIVFRPLQGPSSAHWFGTDEIGRDVFTRVIYGGRSSIGIGLGAAVFAMIVGVPWGLVSGYFGGITDTISMRVTDGMLAFPGIILAMATVAVLGPSTTNVLIAIGIIQIPRFSRLVRAETLAQREREFVSAAIASGASDLYVLRKSILPNVTSTLIVQFTLSFALAVLTEAGLSFIGLGIQPPAPTWGGMLNTAKNFMTQQSLYATVVGSAIFLLVLSLSLIGDGLRDVLDPDRVALGSTDDQLGAGGIAAT